MIDVNRHVLPGFRLSLGYTLFYLSVAGADPAAACFLKAASLTADEFVAAVWTPRARAAYALTFGASFAAAVVNVFLGLLVAWVLVRYEFPVKRLFDALVDLPFALPTAVAGLVYSSLYVEDRLARPVPRAARHRGGLLAPGDRAGADLHRAAVRRAHGAAGAREPRRRDRGSRGLPRRHALADVLGASSLPTLLPAIVTGFALAFARGLGEYGSVVFVSGNMPLQDRDRPGADRRARSKSSATARRRPSRSCCWSSRSPCWCSSTCWNAGASAMAIDITCRRHADAAARPGRSGCRSAGR